jgi:hypothetical protein
MKALNSKIEPVGRNRVFSDEGSTAASFYTPVGNLPSADTDYRQK